uniref:Uncharacterized protein n=1 Tax=Panstrongylus lignarius TaxID=156445 RepID=A0A224Y4N6_9HEMI
MLSLFFLIINLSSFSNTSFFLTSVFFGFILFCACKAAWLCKYRSSSVSASSERFNLSEFSIAAFPSPKIVPKGVISPNLIFFS